jgi:hypothetical protein
MTYNEFPWLPLCGGLTLLGLIVAWLIWRRRGAAAGMRTLAVALIPLAAYLTRAVRMLWQIGSAIASFASSLLLSPQVWSGIGVTVLIVVLFLVSGRLKGRRPARAGADSGPRPAGGPPPGKALKPAGRKPPAPADDDLGDVAEILRRRGIS